MMLRRIGCEFVEKTCKKIKILYKYKQENNCFIFYGGVTMRHNVLFFFGCFVLFLGTSCGDDSPVAPKKQTIQDNIQTEIAFADIENLEIIDLDVRSVRHGQTVIKNIFEIGQGRSGSAVVLVFHYWENAEQTDSLAYRHSIIWADKGAEVVFLTAGVEYMDFILQLKNEGPSDFPFYFTLPKAEESLYLQAQADIQKLCRDLNWEE